MKDDGEPVRLLHAAAIDTTLVVLLWAQLRSARIAGYDVRCASAPGPNKSWLENNGVPHVSIDIRRAISPLTDLKAIWQLYRYLRREKITILHTHTPKVALLGPLAARLARVPVIVNTVHGFYFHEEMPWLPRAFHTAMAWIGGRCTTFTLSQNPEDIETAVRLGICPPDHIRVLGNGVDLTRFDSTKYDAEFRSRKRSEMRIPSHRLVIGTIGRLVKDKGYDELFQAVQMLANERDDFHLAVVGPKETQRTGGIDVEAYLCGGLKDRVTYVGPIDNVEEFLACLDIFVLPSRREGFPRSAIEAAAMGLPIVATDIRGCRQVVTHGTNGLLVPTRAPHALKNAIVSLLDDPRMRERMGRLGRTKALAEFDEKRVCERVLNTYAETLLTRGRSLPTRRPDLQSQLPTRTPFVW